MKYMIHYMNLFGSVDAAMLPMSDVPGRLSLANYAKLCSLSLCDHVSHGTAMIYLLYF